MNDDSLNREGEDAMLRVNEDDPDLEMDQDMYYSYRDELFTGVMTEYYPNDTLAAEVSYQGGRPEGWGRSWYDDGTPKSENFVENRRVVGTSKRWHENGNLAEERRFRNGDLVEIREWDEDGKFVVAAPRTLGFAIPETAEQAALREQVLSAQVEHDQPLPSPLFHVAAVDLRYVDAETLEASAVLFDVESLGQAAESALVRHVVKDVQESTINFEETLAGVEALRELTIPAGLIVCPGNGPNHSVQLNFATHLGLATGKATFGVSEAAYLGAYDEPGPERGAWSDLADDEGTVIGRALRTREGEEPVFVTYGYRLSLDAAVEMTLRLSENSRLPVVTNAATVALFDAGE